MQSARKGHFINYDSAQYCAIIRCYLQRYKMNKLRYMHGIPVALLDVLIPTCIWLHRGRPDFYFRSGLSGLQIILPGAVIWWQIVFSVLMLLPWFRKTLTFRYTLLGYLIFLLLSATTMLWMYLRMFQNQKLESDGLLTGIIVLLYIFVGIVRNLFSNNQSIHETSLAGRS